MLSIAICGAGTAALRAHLPALTRATEAGATAVVAVTDPRPAHREEIALRCPGARGFTDVEGMLDSVAVDLLVVASPPSTHLAAVRAAFEREIDVLCEKPLGVGHGDGDELRALLAAHPDRLLAPVHQYRFAPAWERVRAEAADALAAGEPFRLGVEVERPGTDPLSAGGWRAAGLREGGVLGDHGVHYLALAWTLDPALRLLDASLEGEPGAETASMRLALAGGEAEIVVSYAGSRRRNLVHLERAGGRRLRWLDGELTSGTPDAPDTVEPTAALSERQVVNDLYGNLYEELVELGADPAWRAERRSESLTVAAVLEAALDAVRDTAG